MAKVCFVQKILKDTDFKNGKEKVDFYILKALVDLGFKVDVFCIKNRLTQNYKIKNITELAQENFIQNALAIIEKLNYNFTFATDYIPADVAYLHRHTSAYNQQIVKSKFNTLFSSIFFRKNHMRNIKEAAIQENCINKYKLIFTPSTILKNDLINLTNADGQKIYILHPAIEVPQNVKIKENEIFTFGFIGNDFNDKGGFILLNALRLLTSSFNFKVKIVYPYNKIPPLIRFLIKLHKLEDKIEILPKQDDIEEFYNTIDCFLLPSKKETFGLSVLEAMSKGKIVIVSSRCGAKDIIEHDNNGFIFDVTKNPVRNLFRIMAYILTNKGEFENLRQKAIYTASVYNFEKFKAEFERILAKNFLFEKE